MENNQEDNFLLLFLLISFLWFLFFIKHILTKNIQVLYVYLEITVGVQQEIAWLEVSMQHISRMNVLEAAQDLIEKIAHMLVAYRLRLEQLVQIGLHETLHNVHILHLFDCRRSNYVLDVDDLFRWRNNEKKNWL